MVIGGSGAYQLEKELFGKILKAERVETPFGLSNPVYTLKHPGGFEYYFLSRHGERDYDVTAPFVNYRANIYAAKHLGVERIISWTGPGSIKPIYKPGEYVVPDDLLDFTRGRKSTFFENGGLGFVRQNPVFCPQMRDIICQTLSELGLSYHGEGTYVCTEGPRLETPAEIEAFKRLGGELVGMTLIPEVFLAKELEICYASICYITNAAEGLKEGDFKPGVLFEGLLSEEERKRVEEAVRQFPEIIKKAVEKIKKSERKCSCSRLMERYRKKGKAGKDWKEWLFSF